MSSNIGGNSQTSLKKRAAPLPPPVSSGGGSGGGGGSHRSASKSAQSHNRNASDYGVSLPAQRLKNAGSESHSRKSFAGDLSSGESLKSRPAYQSAANLRNYANYLNRF